MRFTMQDLPPGRDHTKRVPDDASFVPSCCRGYASAIAMAALLSTAACMPAPQTGATPKAGATMPASIVEPYLTIQTSLAQDRLDEVKASAGNIATAATALGAPAMKIDTTALQLASAVELDDAREKFGALSDALVTYMDGLHLKAPDGVRIAFCPMVQKPWLQKGETLANPYYGSSMATCGEFR
jgi:hypothetical protein